MDSSFTMQEIACLLYTEAKYSSISKQIIKVFSNSEEFYSKTTTMSQESSNASVFAAASIGSLMEEAWTTKSLLSDNYSIFSEGLNGEEANKEITMACIRKSISKHINQTVSDNSEDVKIKTRMMSQESNNASVATVASIGSLMEEAWMMKPLLSDEWQCCSICTEGLNCEEVDKEITLPCKHKFHSACVRNWIAKRSSCSLCRINVKPAIPLCRINVEPDVPAMMEEDDEINMRVNIITNMAQIWHFPSL
ncbi:hypothetical protein ACFX2I_023541 [Malus domestica]